MRIIFLETVHNFGGSSKSTLELAERLRSAGHDVLLVDFWGSSKPYVEECLKRNIDLKILDKRDAPILLNNKNKFLKAVNYVNYLWTINNYKKRMLQIIKEFDPELISVNNTKALSILSSSNNYDIAYFARGWFLPKSFNLLSKILLRKRVDVFLTVSLATQQMVYASGFAELSNIFVIYNAISSKDLHNYRKYKDNIVSLCLSNVGVFTMMHCGTFIETKGQHIALEVLKKLIDNGINVRLLLVGLISPAKESNDYFILLSKFVKKHSLEEHVEFIVNKSNVLEYYAKSDLLIHPSYTEGLPRVVLESMAFGNPVIGNAVGGMIDVVSNNFTGYLANFNNIEEYVDFIENVIQDNKKYKFISKNALSLIESNYTEQNQMKSFENISSIISYKLLNK